MALPTPGRADDQLTGHHEDEGDRRGHTQPGGDVWGGAGEGDKQSLTHPAQPIGPGRVACHRVDVLHPVHRLEQQRPGGGERCEEDLAPKSRAKEENGHRYEGHRWDGAEKLDDDPHLAVEEGNGSDQHPHWYRHQSGDAETHRPPPKGRPHRLPELGGDRLVGQRPEDLARRGKPSAPAAIPAWRRARTPPAQRQPRRCQAPTRGAAPRAGRRRSPDPPSSERRQHGPTSSIRLHPETTRTREGDHGTHPHWILADQSAHGPNGGLDCRRLRGRWWDGYRRPGAPAPGGRQRDHGSRVRNHRRSRW